MPIGELEKVFENVWTCSQLFKSTGMKILSRMIIIRLPENKLWIWSPIKISPSLKTQIDALGTVTYLIAPTRFHHLFIGEAKSLYPNALVYGAPGLDVKRPDVHFEGTLNLTDTYPWSPFFQMTQVLGRKQYNESIFLHKESRSLIVTDLLFNISKTKSSRANFFFKIYGVLDRTAPSILVKAILWGRKDAQNCISDILQWNFENLMMAHGTIIKQNGKPAFQKAMKFIL